MKEGNIKPINSYETMKEFENAKEMEFCQNSRYLGVYGKK